MSISGCLDGADSTHSGGQLKRIGLSRVNGLRRLTRSLVDVVVLFPGPWPWV
jgi:hypothetical protein